MPSPEQDRNINRVPVDKLEQKIASAYPTYTRREFIKKTGGFIGFGLLMLGIGTNGIVMSEIERGKENKKIDDEYPKIPSEQVK